MAGLRRPAAKQAQDRAHRIGQKKQVTVYRLLCAGTAEDRIMDFSERKMLLDHVLMSGPVAGGGGGGDAGDDDGDLERVSMSELWEIVRHGSEEVASRWWWWWWWWWGWWW